MIYPYKGKDGKKYADPCTPRELPAGEKEEVHACGNTSPSSIPEPAVGNDVGARYSTGV